MRDRDSSALKSSGSDNEVENFAERLYSNHWQGHENCQ